MRGIYVHTALPAHFIPTADTISNELFLKLNYAMNIKQCKAVAHRHSSINASHDIVITIYFFLKGDI